MAPGHYRNVLQDGLEGGSCVTSPGSYLEQEAHLAKRERNLQLVKDQDTGLPPAWGLSLTCINILPLQTLEAGITHS